jgi:hypothetical protein
MKYCDKCKVSVNSTKSYCPLCYSDLSDSDEQDCEECYPDLENDIRMQSKYSFRYKVMLFLSFVTASTCVFINLMWLRGMLWSLIVVLGIFLSWEIVVFLILGKNNPGFKVVCNMIIIPVAFTILDAITGWHQWSINLVIPFSIIAATLAITIILYKKRTKWREYMIYQLIITINGLLPGILYLFGFTTVLWPVGVSLLYAGLTIIGIWIFADKQLGNELKKRFHL